MMKRLSFESLELLSLKERSARQIRFHQTLTVIKGENDVGKSSVIKSIYWALGAEPEKLHTKWVSANVKACLRFSVDGVPYAAVRDQNTIGIFDAAGSPLIVTSQITKELAPYIAKLIDFGIVLNNRGGTPEIPPPAYAFLPFYIDQDHGWNKPFASFANLTQYPNFRKPLLEFHTGILPNEYWQLEAEKRRLRADQKVLEADRTVVRKAVERFRLEVSFDGLELSIQGHEVAIEKLLLRLQVLRQIRQGRAKKLAELQDERMLVEQQVQVVKGTIRELERDAQFATDLPMSLFCPTCGTEHTNDFANQFGIVEDREACFEFISSARNRVIELIDQAGRAEGELRAADQALREIDEAINAKRSQVSLAEVIENRGRGIASEMFEKQIFDLETKIGALAVAMKDIAKRIKELKDKERRAKIETFFRGKMLTFLIMLNVDFSDEDMLRLPAKINETGSDLPCAILAYYLAVLHTVQEHSSALFAPMVVDSPNQQDQDEKNVANMIDLLIEQPPPNSQLILGTVSMHGRAVKVGSVIEFDEKYSVLQADQFAAVNASMAPFLAALRS
ncbi:ATP-binding protein [Sphingomonas pituitosa]|uniref:ATP-binding protein n=1 Tax=Sphingomonas pituitosa TaxID=99597 RepID=UPI000837022A|nr:ATP-binding protein [Sphingomonas pituitosa]